MNEFVIKFAVSLEDYSLGIWKKLGARFHRWLPDGEKDAIVLPGLNPDLHLKIWFERRGYVEDGFIRYDNARKEVEPSIMSRQGVLEAGPLRGLLTVTSVDDEQYNAVIAEKREDEAYTVLGKKIVKIIYEAASTFIDILRIYFGQHWVKQLYKWDARSQTLGSYCSLLNMQWSIDQGQTWKDFRPTELAAYVKSSVGGPETFEKFLTQEDWQTLRSIILKGDKPTLTAVLISQTHELLNQGRLRHALIEGVTALEAGLQEFLKTRMSEKELRQNMADFWERGLRVQVTVIAAASGLISEQELISVLEIIELRNGLIHGELLYPPESSTQQLRMLLSVVSKLIEGAGFKFPRLNVGNMLLPE